MIEEPEKQEKSKEPDGECVDCLPAHIKHAREIVQVTSGRDTDLNPNIFSTVSNHFVRDIALFRMSTSRQAMPRYESMAEMLENLAGRMATRVLDPDKPLDIKTEAMLTDLLGKAMDRIDASHDRALATGAAATTVNFQDNRKYSISVDGKSLNLLDTTPKERERARRFIGKLRLAEDQLKALEMPSVDNGEQQPE